VNVENVLPKDAIPSIDDPQFGAEHVGDPGDEVVVLEGDPARAYPIRILSYHEIVNDTVAGLTAADADTPVAVTWCPLCGSAVAYERLVDGEELTFGVSGKLADDDLVMYDRETDSEWKQSLGAAIAGDLEGRELSILPAAMTTVTEFRDSYPDGEVLQPVGTPSEAASDDATPADVDYSVDPYEEYFTSEGFGLDAHREREGRAWGRDDLDPKTVVLGIQRGDEAVGYPRPRVDAAGGVLTDRVGGMRVVVFATADGLHAFADPGCAFRMNEDGSVRGDGTRWNPVTGESDDGRRLSRVPAQRLFAFAWQDDYGPDAFYE
jgi:hypothetical protein